MSTTPIELLSDDRNFGQWLEKINEVITGLTANDNSTADAQSKIEAAMSTGQMGEAVTATSSDSCLHSGLYHINASGTSPAINLYVASNGNCVTQLSITEETTPKIYIRSKLSSESPFSNWIELAEKYYTEATFLKLKGGKITGDLTVSGETSTGTLHSGDATFVGNINIEKSTSKLKITNDAQTVTFDGSLNSSPHIAYYVNKANGFVSTDKNNENVEYYIHKDTDNKSYLSHYNIEYYIHNRLNTLDEFDTGERYYYIQKDNRITMTLNDNTTYFYKEGNTILNSKKDDLVYFIINDDVYSYTNQLYIDGNDVYNNEDKTNKLYSIENSTEVVYYATIGKVDREQNIVLSPQNEILYYIHSDNEKEYLSYYEEKGVSKEYFITEDGVYSDEGCLKLVYSIENGIIKHRIVMYYINTMKDNEENSYVAWCVMDEDGKLIPSLYVFKNRVISLNNTPTYKVSRYLDTISPDKDGLNTRFFIQKNNNVTSDIEGVQIIYILNDKFMSSVHTPDTPMFHVWKKDKNDETEKVKLITQTPRYYIQPAESNGMKPVSSDKEGKYVEFYYNETAEAFDVLLYANEPIRIDLLTNVCNINGNAKTADALNQLGLTHSYESGETNLAASGKALMDFNNQVQGTYIPFTGGTFTGYVIHSDDIILGKTAKIKAYEQLKFHSQGEISFVVNSDSGKIFIDKHDGVEGKQDGEIVKLPCVFGARTRTGITNAGVGDVLYNLGSIEFTEDNTRIRYRKTNATGIVDVDKDNDISLYLTPTSFHPSVDNVVSLGNSTNYFAQIYAVTDNITTSDKTMKTSIKSIDKSLLKEWKNVEWMSYKLKSSVDKKGESARTHTGLIAQEIRDTIPNADNYGFFCEDNGKLALRYQEIQAVENAYLREEIKLLKKEVDALKKKIK